MIVSQIEQHRLEPIEVVQYWGVGSSFGTREGGVRQCIYVIRPFGISTFIVQSRVISTTLVSATSTNAFKMLTYLCVQCYFILVIIGGNSYWAIMCSFYIRGTTLWLQGTPISLALMARFITTQHTLQNSEGKAESSSPWVTSTPKAVNKSVEYLSHSNTGSLLFALMPLTTCSTVFFKPFQVEIHNLHWFCVYFGCVFKERKK